MSETPGDDYLWSGEGPVDLELARLERELATLRWRATPLRLPIATRDPPELVQPGARVEPARTRGRPALFAGLAMAAAVSIGIYVGRRPSEVDPPANEPTPTILIQPAGQPTTPRPIDPFSPTPDSPMRDSPTRDSNASARDLLDPFAPTNEQTPTPRTHSDLKDPFSGSEPRSFDKPAPQPNSTSSDRNDPSQPPAAEDPFAKSEDESGQSRHGELVDPFRRTSSEPGEPRGRSQDLVDPFARER